MIVDTHCHIHQSDYPVSVDAVISRLKQADVGWYVCVGTDRQSSTEAIDFCKRRNDCYSAVGVHPHETRNGYQIDDLLDANSVIAIGEIGLDYFYEHSPRDVQQKALIAQLKLAVKHDLPVIFHVRDAFDDFWPIFDSFDGRLRGVLHSFTDTIENLQRGLERGLYIGVNGISTFVKDPAAQSMYDQIPLDRLVFETDAPFLTPAPLRGKVNEPANVRLVAEYHAARRSLSFDDIAKLTSDNAANLFGLN
ncbi:preprotein translocase [Candidatus Saccharibacteria bacterium 32-50-10]|nr:MAG: preprotein translocase [Candidatus Saccharibacteria bacterium 32-50-10]